LSVGAQPPAGPQLSPDGKFYWDGQRWQPVPQSQSKTPIDRAITYCCGCIVALILLFWTLVILGAVTGHST